MTQSSVVKNDTSSRPASGNKARAGVGGGVRVGGGGSMKDRGGFSATLLLLHLRWRMIRSKPFKLGIVILAVLFVIGLYSSVNLGYLVQLTAQQGGDTAQVIYATAWISALDSGYIASIGALAIGGAVLVAFFAPLTGTSTLSLVSYDDSLGVRPPRMHRFWDSLVINTSSGIGLLQFVTLTAVTSLVTIDGFKFWALIFTWVLWFSLVCVNTTLGFVFELFQRKWGVVRRRVVVLSALAIVGVAVLLDDKHGTDLFGLAKYYNDGLRLSVESFNWLSVALVSTTTLFAIIMMVIGVYVAGSALALPEKGGNKSGEHRSKHYGGSSGFLTAVLLIGRTLFRTKESRKPVITIILLGLPVAFFMKLDETLIIAFTMTVPLALSLGWAVNLFGVIGQGMYWLGSQPKVMYYLPRVSFLFQVVFSFVLLGAFWLIADVRGNVTDGATKVFLIATFMNTFATAALSSLIAVSHPVRASLKNRGDALTPPLTTLIYLVIIVVFGCLPGIVAVQQESALLQYWMVGCSITISMLVTLFSWKLWDRPRRRAEVTSIVAVE